MIYTLTIGLLQACLADPPFPIACASALLTGAGI
jgi:hypothetical protein